MSGIEEAVSDMVACDSMNTYCAAIRVENVYGR